MFADECDDIYVMTNDIQPALHTMWHPKQKHVRSFGQCTDDLHETKYTKLKTNRMRC